MFSTRKTWINWSINQWRAAKLSGAGVLALGGEAEGIGLVWPGEEKAWE